MSKFVSSVFCLAAFAMAMPAAANSLPQTDATGSTAPSSSGWDVFVPAPAGSETRIDYAFWDEALKYFVYRMGASDRRAAPSVEPRTGTRLVYGHESRYRLEGNRVAFTFLEQDQIASITAYRQDLERIGTEVGLASLSRNEQLAYWMNLHNVAVIEQIALAYPVKRKTRITIGPDDTPLDEAKIITVAGLELSPKDIRTRIVYPNWQDPRVIYGFFTGEIGGPTIQRTAFTGENVSAMLAVSATEFVRSLRGTERRGRTLHVSTLYAEAAPFFFPNFDADLRGHLRTYAGEELRAEIDTTSMIEISLQEGAISDLAGGEFDPELVLVGDDNRIGPMRLGGIPIAAIKPRPHNGVPRNISRLAQERNEKLQRMLRNGELRGIVTVLDQEPEPGEEVE